MTLKILNLTKKYDSTKGIFDINLELPDNIIFGLIGGNGAGKTTTLGILSTLIIPTSGDVLINEASVVKNPDDVKEFIGFLPHETEFYLNKTPLQNLIFYAMLSGFSKEEARIKAEELLIKIGLSDQKNSKINNLSNGMKKQLGIAQAIIHKPKILLLDEPFSGLDANSKVVIKNLIIELKKETTVILSSHDLDIVEKICDRIAIINKGKIIVDDEVKNIKLTKNQVTIEFEKNESEIVPKLKKVKGVKNIREEGNKLIITFNSDIDNVIGISKVLSSNNINPLSIIRGNSIEDIFIENSQ